jgi:polygalacturonase
MKVVISEQGAKNDGRFNNAAIINAAIQSVHESGGGQVVIPSGGVYLSGSIALRKC